MEEETRTFAEIAREIYDVWATPWAPALPYMQAMLYLSTSDPNELYGMDTAGEIVRRFLANAWCWKGPDARRIKKELGEMAGL